MYDTADETDAAVDNDTSEHEHDHHVIADGARTRMWTSTTCLPVSHTRTNQDLSKDHSPEQPFHSVLASKSAHRRFQTT